MEIKGKIPLRFVPAKITNGGVNHYKKYQHNHIKPITIIDKGYNTHTYCTNGYMFILVSILCMSHLKYATFYTGESRWKWRMDKKSSLWGDVADHVNIGVMRAWRAHSYYYSH